MKLIMIVNCEEQVIGTHVLFWDHKHCMQFNHSTRCSNLICIHLYYVTQHQVDEKYLDMSFQDADISRLYSTITRWFQ